jgi:hypothetical protein
MASVGLRTLADDGFVLAGGCALRAHGFGDRDSDDIDLFTDVLDSERFAQAVERLVRTYREDGRKTEIARQVQLFARLVVTDEHGATAKTDLGVDHRAFPPMQSEVGPVLSEQDSVGSKVGAVYSRLEPRDLIDVQAVLDSRRYDPDTLLELADVREATPLDRPMFAAQLLAASHLPDSARRLTSVADSLRRTGVARPAHRSTDRHRRGPDPDRLEPEAHVRPRRPG